MHRIVVFLSILFWVTAAAAISERPFRSLNGQRAPASAFTFAVLGDFRPAKRGLPYHDVFRQALATINRLAPAFLVSTGDAYYGYGGGFSDFHRDVDGLFAVAGEFAMPFYNVVGNHDVTDDRSREAFLREKAGNLYGSVDYAGSHFIFLDTEEVGKRGTVTGDQLQWLEKDLDMNRQAETVFVFLHRPLFSVEDPEFRRGRSFVDRNNRDYLHRLFVRYGVRAVFAGHEHLYDRRVKGGVTYVITGGGGSPLSPLPATAFFHFLLIHVNGRDARIEVLGPEGRSAMHSDKGRQ